ncbi:MAG: rod shape-determining protein MreC [Oscillospiraceae bacterium]|nr:rod shape-determining protein MreC [Oscillospiraceae bacterium]
MLRFIVKHKGAVIAGAAVLLALSMAVSSFFTKGRVSPVSSAVNTVFRPLHRLIGSIDDYFTRMSDAVNRYDELSAEHERIRVYLAQILEDRRSLEDVLNENALLRELLGLQPKLSGFTQLEMASVVARNPSEWERTLLLSKGSEAGIEVGQCVISSEMFLVGVVTQAGAGWAVVTTVIDTTMSAGAKVSRTGQTAIAEGEWGLMRDGRLRLSYLPLGSDILHGDLILTSGLGDVYPPGLPIGTVAAVQTDMSGQTEYAELIPEARLDAVNQVFVVLEYVHTE